MGTNTLNSASDGTVIPASDNNQYKTALGEDLVPRNTSGVPTDQGGSLGTTILRWLNAYINKIFIGAIASALTIEESSGDLVLSVGGSSKKYTFKIGSNTPLEVSDTALTHRVSGTSCLESNNTNFLYKISGTNVIEANATNFLYKISGVTKAAIDTNGINRNYFGALNYSISSSSGVYNTTSTTYVDVTNLSVSLTTNGRPVVLLLIADGASAGSYSKINGSGSASSIIAFLRDSTNLGEFTFDNTALHNSMSHFTTQAAGTYTFKVQGKVVTGSTLSVTRIKLVAIEL